MTFADIKAGSRVTILIPCGIGRDGQEYKPKTGRAVMRGPYGWVLNMGGRYGTPAIATVENTLRVSNARKSSRSAMDIAADACGLKKVRGALGGTYYE